MTKEQLRALSAFSGKFDGAIEAAEPLAVRVPKVLPGGGKLFGKLRVFELGELAKLFEEAKRDIERVLAFLEALQRAA